MQSQITINQAALFLNTTGKLLRRRLQRVESIADEVGGVRSEFKEEWLPLLKEEWPNGTRPTTEDIQAILSTTTTSTTSTTTSTTVRAARSTAKSTDNGPQSNIEWETKQVQFRPSLNGNTPPKDYRRPARNPKKPSAKIEVDTSAGPNIPVWVFVLPIAVFALVDSIAFGWIAFHSMGGSMYATGLLGAAGVAVAVSAAVNNLVVKNKTTYRAWAWSFMLFQVAIWGSALFAIWTLGKILIACAVGVAFFAMLEGLREKYGI